MVHLGGIIQHSCTQCACVMRKNVLGFKNGYIICCFDGPMASNGAQTAVFGDTYLQNWQEVGPNITGTIDITTGTTALNGTNTSFTTQLSPGDKLIVGEKQGCVDTVISDTLVSLSEPYTGTTLSGANLWKL